MPKVSVLIPTYNCAQYIGQAIQSVFDQTFQDFEIIVSDNASTDNTEEVVKSFKDSRIRYHRSKVTIEMGNNWNKCLSFSKGEYVTILCADDIWLPSFLEKTTEILNSYPEVGLVFTNHYYFRASKEWVRSKLVSPGTHFHFAKMVIQKNPIPISATLIRRACLDDVGEFLPYITADYDMWLRISKTKWGAYYIDLPMAKYRMHGSNLSKNIYEMSEHTIKVLENHQFDKEVEEYKRKILAKLYVNRALNTNISSLSKGTLLDIYRAIEIGKIRFVYLLLFLSLKKLMPNFMNILLKRVYQFFSGRPKFYDCNK